jgi:formamidopyrimidine-DNA glycosylase
MRRPWSGRWSKLLVGSRVQFVLLQGKWIILYLDRQAAVLIHLGMSGQLTVAPSGQPLAPPTHDVLTLDQGETQLRFCDPRRFGGWIVFPNRTQLVAYLNQECKLGPEPFDMDPSDWQRRLAATRRCLKAVLLDQQVVAGVGNIYADESLFEARLHPGRQGAGLNPGEAKRLQKAMATVLERAINRRGSSIRNYVGGSGLKGEYQNEFRVYGRTGEPCPRCRTPITCVRLAGRSTHFCPRCQPPVRRVAFTR